MTTPEPEAGAFDVVCSYARGYGVDVSSEELAELAEELSMSSREVSSVAAVFAYLAERKRAATVETLLRPSKLPQKVPRLRQDPGPRLGGPGEHLLDVEPLRAKEHRVHRARRDRKDALGQAFGRKCCLLGYKPTT